MVKFLDWFEIDLPDFMDNQYGEFLILLGIWLIIGIIAMLVVRPLVRSLLVKTKTDVDDTILSIIEWPVLLLVFLYGVVSSLSVLNMVPDVLWWSIWNGYKLLTAIVVIYLAYKAFRAVFIPLGTEYSRKRDRRWEKSLLPLLDSLGGVLIVIVGMFWIFTVMGVDVTVFLAGMGVAGLVLAFALQDTLSNYFSGLHLMLDRPFEVGDTIEINDEFMEVLNVGMRSTRLYNIFAHEVVNMPNNLIANQMLTVITKPDLEYRVAVNVGVAYGSPVEKVKEILFEAVRSNDEVILDDEEKRPRVNFTDFGDSSLQFRVRFFVRDVMEQWRVMTAVREHIDRRFREEGITIPFPQRTISYLDDREERPKEETTSTNAVVPSPV